MIYKAVLNIQLYEPYSVPFIQNFLHTEWNEATKSFSSDKPGLTSFKMCLLHYCVAAGTSDSK